MSRYVLSDREESELGRLRFQHEVWGSETEDLLDRCGVAPGSRVLDLGCGPGFLTLDLTRRVGPTGRVMAVDASDLFSGHLRHRTATEKLDNVEVLRADLRDWNPPNAAFDVALCRWVLMFVDDPAAVVRAAHAALRPGGTIGLFEYSPFLDIAVEPPAEEFDCIYRAVARLIRDAGGDPDVGGRLPELLAAAGFDDIDRREIRRSDVPGSPLWEWIVRTGENHGNLVERGLVTAAELESYHALMRRRGMQSEGRFIAPTVQSVVARRA